MKKMVLAVCLLAALAGSAAAQPALEKGMDSKRFTTEELNKVRYVGAVDRNSCWITEGKKHVKQVAVLNVDLESPVTVVLPGSGDMDVLAASIEGRQVAVMLADQSEKKRTVVYRAEVDLDTRSVRSYDTLLGFGYDRKDKCMVWGATSPDGRYNALVGILQYHDSERYQSMVVLYDGNMNSIWNKEFALGSMHDLMVTNEGRIVTFGREEYEGEVRFVFNTLDADRAASYAATVKCDPVEDIHLVSVVGPYAVAAGTFHPGDVRKADQFTAGVMTLSFHLDSSTHSGITMRPFQNEDINMFLNRKTKKIQKEQYCDHIVNLGTTPTAFGGVIALGRRVLVETTSQNGVVKRAGRTTGVHLAAVDTLGRVRWVRNLRRNAVQKEGDEMLGLGVSYVDGKVCVVMTEHPKSPMVYDIADDAHETSVGSAGNVVLYTISNTGDTQKLLLERKVKQAVFRQVAGRNDGLLFFSGNGKKCRLAELKFHY